MQKRIACFLMACLMLVSMFTFGNAAVTAFAATTEYTTAEEDLAKADNFSLASYPAKSSDLALYVEQIALSDDLSKLYVYVYIPSWNNSRRTATSINISKSNDPETLDYINYKLTPCDTDGVLHKYLVDGFKVLRSNPTYINVSSIFGKPYAPGSLLPDTGPIVTEESFAVAKIYTLFIDGTVESPQITYYCEEVEVVEITALVGGYLMYTDIDVVKANFAFNWYVAFSTDRDIDELYEADVMINKALVAVTAKLSMFPTRVEITNTEFLSDEQKDYITVSHDRKAGVDFGDIQYEWDEIYTASAFVEREKDKLPDSEIADILSKQYVLRYFTTNVDVSIGGDGMFSATIEYEHILDVTILRLNFMSNGVVYNLGVVSDKVQTDKVPEEGDVIYDSSKNNLNWLKKLLGLIFVGVIIFIFWPVFKPVLSYIGKGLVWIITLPFKAVDKLVKKLKKSKRKK